MSQVIVVGGGLSGLASAHQAIMNGASVVLLDKNAFLGGNSTKATSGINGAGTSTQREHKVADSPEVFAKDTALSATGGADPNPTDLAKVLTYNSADAVEWLKKYFGLDLSLISRLGGHSFPRTHRGTTRFPGMTITYALMEKLEEIAEKDPKTARIIKKARVQKLLRDAAGNVVGCEYTTTDGKKGVEHGPVVLATGGYGAGGLSKDSLLHKVRGDLVHLPTTNGEHCTGDGIAMALDIGCGAVDLKHVQVHPTGLVHPERPNDKVKFLAAEALRGVGGLLLDCEGNRFCNELGRRDYVTGEMWKRNKGPYRLVLNGAASKEIEWHCKHYAGRGLMKKLTGPEFARVLGVPISNLEKTFAAYNKIAETGKCPFGKLYFKNTPWSVDDTFYVAIVTPVVHYSMGGVAISPEGAVLKADGSAPQPGLFACGEVTGGVHGKNRLGGSALLECVVYGRVAGNAASRHLLSHLIKEGPKGVAGPGSALKTSFTVAPDAKKVSFEVTWDQGSAAPTITSTAEDVSAPKEIPIVETTADPTPTTSPPPSAAAKEEAAAPASKGEYTMEEIAKHNKEDDCWVVIDGTVLDVTTFLADHPGGKPAIMLYAGKDATEEFDMLHERNVIEKYAPHTIIGTVKPSSKL